MSLDPSLVVAGGLVGLLVGLTGMGGGALLTPILVLIFGVPPLAAVSSDLVTSLVMKPFGAAVHHSARTINTGLLKWLCVGSVPAAFASSVLVGTLFHGDRAATMGQWLKYAIAIALLAAVGGTLHRLLIDRRRRAAGIIENDEIVIRPGRTVLIGAIGGVAVGFTSVGAGSLIIAMLLVTYPRLRPQHLVGTDIAQAIPLVAAASLGHLLFGDVRLSLTASLLLGAIPMVILGALLSSRAPSGFIQPVMAGVLVASALALLKVPTAVLLIGALGAVVLVAVLRRGATPSNIETDGLLSPHVDHLVGTSRQHRPVRVRDQATDDEHASDAGAQSPGAARRDATTGDLLTGVTPPR